MSAGPFEIGKYQSNFGFIFPCRVQPETKALTIGAVANAYPAAAVDSGLPRAQVSKTKREFGVGTRKVLIELTANGTGAQSEYTAGTVLSIPVFTTAAFNAYTDGSTGTYLGIACIVKGRSEESVR